MKTLAIFLIVFSVVVISKALTQEEKMQAMQKIVKDCAEKEKATQADLEELMAGKSATSPTAKCHRACMHETFGTMKDKKFIPEAFIAMINMKFDGDASKVEIAKEIVKICDGMTDPDRCEAGAKICKCLGENSRAKGLA